MNNRKLFSLGAVSLLILTACGGSAGIKNLATPSSIGMDATVDTESFFFGSDEKVFPSSECNSTIFRLLSDASEFKQTNLLITKGKSSDLHQQALTFESEEKAVEVLDLVKSSVSSNCDESNYLYKESIFAPTPTSGFGEGISGITWTNSGSQATALSCDGPNALYFESQVWVIQKSSEILITSVAETTCGDDDLALGEAKRTEIGEKAIRFALQ